MRRKASVKEVQRLRPGQGGTLWGKFGTDPEGSESDREFGKKARKGNTE